jgi:uncharacterized membrane protein
MSPWFVIFSAIGVLAATFLAGEWLCRRVVVRLLPERERRDAERRKRDPMADGGEDSFG